MTLPLTSSRAGRIVPIQVVSKKSHRSFVRKQKKRHQKWLKAMGFRGKNGEVVTLPGADGAIEQVVLGSDGSDLWSFSSLASKLPRGKYEIVTALAPAAADQAATGFALAAYRFDRYRTVSRTESTLLWPEQADPNRVRRLVEGITLTRDLINTPASDLGPEELCQAAVDLAKRHGAKAKQIAGDKLLKDGFPAVHAVGRASTRAPRLVDLVHGNPQHPKLTLVGKGVCFDSGGLDLKSASGMKLMKKDMGGAALVLGLAHTILDSGLPVRLRVLIPAVENSVSGNAFRPLDVLSTRKGLSVEVGNTDAEGRLILSDALTEGASEKPDLLVDAATLTGASRIALGTGLPALFSNDDDWANAILAAGEEQQDPLWRMPLFDPYRKQLDSPIADLNNIGSSSYGGAITAALFLREFIEPDTPWVHIDTMAYNLESRPGRPKGGEALALRALYHALETRYL